MQPIILASKSPRRVELLGRYGIPFRVVPSDAREDDVTGSGSDRVQVLARRKCEEVAARFPGEAVIGADTLVCVDDEILGKPHDAADAARMLRLLSGREHSVVSGLCLKLPDGTLRVGYAETRVHFLPMTDAEIDAYIAGGEPMDKAGAYAIQGQASVFIDAIHGSPSNVVGLPLALLTDWLRDAGITFRQTDAPLEGAGEDGTK